MALYGNSIPTDHGEFVVTIICPNSYAHQKLMQACAGIVPSAGAPASGTNVPSAGTEVIPPENIPVGQQASHHAAEAPMPPFDPLQEDDTGEPYPNPSCSNGGCGE